MFLSHINHLNSCLSIVSLKSSQTENYILTGREKTILPNFSNAMESKAKKKDGMVENSK
jgi:hypothetical protein